MQKFTPQQYLAIDIANNFGLDKADWDERLDWFNNNNDRLMELLPQAETPALYYAGVNAWYNVQAGQPIGYPISLDATASGFQLLAVVTGDRKAAELCNVVSTGRREDAYTSIYQSMLVKTGDTAKITRAMAKDAIMTSLYGSEAQPKEVFGEGNLLNVFYQTMSESAPAVWELNQAFISLWDSEALMNSWTLPDNFHVHVKVMKQVTETVHFMNQPFDTFRQVNEPTEKGRSLCANTTHSLDSFVVRELTRRCDYNVEQIHELRRILFTVFDQPDEVEESDNTKMVQILWEHYEKSGYLSARILDYLDEDSIWLVERDDILELIESLPEKPFKVISVHDCFRVLPNYGNDLREQYNRQLYLIAKSNMLGYLLSQLTGRPLNIGKLDPTLKDDILTTEYALS